MAASVLTKDFESQFLRRIQYSNHSTPSHLRVTTLNNFWTSSSFHLRQARKSVRAKSGPNRETVRGWCTIPVLCPTSNRRTLRSVNRLSASGEGTGKMRLSVGADAASSWVSQGAAISGRAYSQLGNSWECQWLALGWGQIRTASAVSLLETPCAR